jgi:hypothetical protein
VNSPLLNDKQITEVADFIHNLHQWVTGKYIGKDAIDKLTEQYDRVLPLLVKGSVAPKTILLFGDLSSGNVEAFDKRSSEIEDNRHDMGMMESPTGVTYVPSIAIFSETLKAFGPQRVLGERGDVITKEDWRNVIIEESLEMAQVAQDVKNDKSLRAQHPLYDRFENTKFEFIPVIAQAKLGKDKSSPEFIEKTVWSAVDKLAAAVVLHNAESHSDTPYFKQLMVKNGICKEGETPTIDTALNEVRKALMAQKMGSHLRQQIVRNLKQAANELSGQPRPKR